MALIDQINGSLLQKLSGTSTTSTTNNAASTVNGKGRGAVLAASSSNVSTGIAAATRALSASYVRLNTALSAIQITRDRVGELSDSADHLLDLATSASDPNRTENERAELNSLFQAEVTKYRSTQGSAETSQADLLNKDDLETILRQAGVDPSGATTLAESFSRLGGNDGVIGHEDIVSQDVTVVTPQGIETSTAPTGKSDPLEQDLQTQSGAARAVEDLTKLVQSVHDDNTQISAVADELFGGLQFTYVAAKVFDSFSTNAFGSPDDVAGQIVSAIRSQTRDTSLGEHSQIDTTLAKTLLNGG